MSSRMRWRSSRLMFCALNLPSFLFPDCAAAIPAVSESISARRRPFMAAGMLRGFAFEGVSPLPKFVTMYCPMPELKTRILVVDDDQRLRDLLVRYLGGEGYEVRAVPDATGMDKQLARERYDLVVLDLMLPGEDGLAICRRLRAQQTSPAIIMLTAKGDDVDRIAGLPGAPAALGELHRFGPFEFNLAMRSLTREGKSVPLTTGEFSVLKVLVQHPRQPLSRDKLMELARGREYEVFDRSIDVQISRLRKIVEQDPSHPRHIQTVWGFGYVFVPDDQANK